MGKLAKGILSLFLPVFGLPLMGQVSVYIFPQTQQIAVNGIQTFTAVVTGVEDKGISWETTCGTIIQGANATIGLKDGSQQTCTVTATSTADRTKSAKGTVTYVATPHFEDGVHPRLLLTPRMVALMRTHGWATDANPYWKNGLEKTAFNAVKEVDSKWCFSFGGNCPKGARVGNPLRFYEPSLYTPPAITSLTRSSSGIVTVALASQFNIWAGDTVNITPAVADQSNFKKAAVVVASVLDGTHFTYKDDGDAAASMGAGSLYVACGNANLKMWCDTGGLRTPIFDATETYAQLFAFLSLIDANTTNQERYRIRAHDMMMWMINLAADMDPEACQNSVRSVPLPAFQNCVFPIGDRAHQAGMEAFPLTVDWIYSSFTPAEKKTIVHVFKLWAHEAITRSSTGIPYPLPFGVMNDPSLLSKPKQLRWLMNNLGDSQYRTVTMMGLVMDAADDPSDDGIAADRAEVIPLPKDLKTHSLEGYSQLAQGAWTYIHWAEAEDPGVVSTALGVSPAGLGEAQGGLSPEGSEYGGNYGYIATGLLALHTAGADDPTHMPQLSFLTSSDWDLWIDGILNTISPVPRSDRFGTYYEPTQFGDDSEGNFLSSEYMKLLMPLGLYDYYTQTNPRRLNAIRWLVKRGLKGGCGDGPDGACGSSSQFLYYNRLIASVGTNDFNRPIYVFLLLDPAATPNSLTNPSGDIDPRPQYPTEFYAPGHHEMAARSSWKPDASWIVTHCNWIGIDHQRGDCGQTEFYRKGRWLSKAHATYTNVVGRMDMFSNSGITIGNPNRDPNPRDYYSPIATHGAQYDYRGAGGFSPSPLLSIGLHCLYEYFDQTDEHNNNMDVRYHPDIHTSDVLHASRSIVWLKPDILVFYDRGISKSAGMFKRDSFNFTAEPQVTGQVAKVVDSVTKQQTFLTTVLPAGANFSASVCTYGSSVGDCAEGDVSSRGDESAFLYQLSDASVPKSTAFLSVMEGVDAGRSRSPVELVQGNNTALDGVEVGNSVVLFKRVPPGFDGGFVSSSYSVPASVVNHYVAGLEPGVNYGVEARAGNGKMDVTVSKRCAANCLAADKAGLLVFSTTPSGGVTKGSKPYAAAH